MAGIQENLILRVLNHYGVKPQSIELIQKKLNRQVWKVDDGSHKYALKYVAKTSKAERIAGVSRYLEKKGFPVTSLVPTIQGNHYLQQDSSNFLLFQWKDGKHPSGTKIQMIARMAELLARFHETSRGYIAAGGPMTTYRMDWTKIYSRKLKRLNYLRKCAEAKGDAFSKLFLAQYPYLKSRIKWALQRLPETSFKELLLACQADPSLGHGDYSRGNLILDAEGRLFLMDFDTISIALPMRDISHLITSVNHVHGAWSDERFRLILDSYGKVRPLSEKEFELLLIDQVFPNKALRIGKQQYIAGSNRSLCEAFELCITIDQQKLAALAIGPNK